MKINIKRRWIPITASVVTIVLIYTIFSSFKKNELNYITVPVIRGNIETAIIARGVLAAKNQVNVNSRITGTLEKLYIKHGQKVRKGQLLAKMDSAKQKNDLSKSQSGLANKVAQKRGEEIRLIKAKQALSRQRQMIKSGATSQASLQDAEAEVLIAQSRIEELNTQINIERSTIKEANLIFNDTFIRSPIDGTVIHLTTKEGEHVVAAQEAPVILRIAQLDIMTVKAKVSEVDIMQIRAGQNAYFSIFGMPKKHFSATLSDIELFPSNYSRNESESSVYYNVYFDVPNPQKILRVGMTAQVTIPLKRAKNVLLIPSSALEEPQIDGRYAVKVLEANGKAQRRLIRVGINNHSMVQVLSGLKLNEKVIIGVNQDEKTDGETSEPTSKKTKGTVSFG